MGNSAAQESHVGNSESPLGHQDVAVCLPATSKACGCLPAGRVVFREFATPTETSGPFGELQNLASQLYGLMTGNPQYTDNASVNLAAVDAAAARSTSSGSNGKLLLAMSETPVANYLLNPDDLSTVEQVAYSDGLPGDLTTAHPSILSDGSLLNFSRSLPNGGFHVFKQDPHTLRRTEVGRDSRQAGGQGHPVHLRTTTGGAG